MQTDQEICHTIIENLPQSLVYVDKDNVIRYLNKAAKKHYYEKQGHENVVGKNILDVHNKAESKRKFKELLERLLETKQKQFFLMARAKFRCIVSTVAFLCIRRNLILKQGSMITMKVLGGYQKSRMGYIPT